MTLNEFNIQMEAAQLRWADQLYLGAVYGMANRYAQATDDESYYLAKKASDIFDLEAAEAEIFPVKKLDAETFRRLMAIQKNLQEYEKRGDQHGQ